jgi:hypothetical protein
MNEPDAIILSAAPDSAAPKFARLLTFFGVPSRCAPPADFGNLPATGLKFFCRAEVFLQLLAETKRNSSFGRFWLEKVHSVFVHAGDDFSVLTKLAAALDNAALVETGADEFVVTDKLDDLCGVMSGIRCAAPRGKTAAVPVLKIAGAANIISRGGGAVFLRLLVGGVPVFLSTANELIDLDAPLRGRVFDIRDYFLAAVPLVLYVKWAFAEVCWRAPEVNACLVIDDPLLQPTYGYVNYAKFLALMQTHSFSTNIAFIPWNWARSHSEVVRLFRENPGKFSLSVHGCDHTAGEFGHREKNWLTRRAAQAVERMDRHAASTGIVHDRVMVLPQGVFTEAAPGILKQNGFLAIVNSEVFTTDPQPRPIKISSVWEVAVMDYDNFPIYTRRGPAEGVENFAFDILLGKPCIALIHHDFCWDGCAGLVKTINQLNALHCKLHWRSLGEVVRRGFRQRRLASGAMAVEMYGSELRLENPSPQPQRFLIRKREAEPAFIQEIFAGKKSVAWKISDGRVNFEVELEPGQSLVASIKFHELSASQPVADGIYYRLKTGLRRHLCELRDNYVTKIKFALRPPPAS